MSQYPLQEIEKAVKACQEGLMSVRAAAKYFEIPKSTLQDRVSGTGI